MQSRNFKNNITLFLLLGLFIISVWSCSDAPPEKKETETKPTTATTKVVLEAENAIATTGEITKEASSVATPASGATLSFDVEVPTAGRYRFEVLGKGLSDSTAVWMEDYIDNKDGRTYNVTGSVPLTETGTAGVDGSPLNKGLHKMKLHVKGPANIDKVSFDLMVKHQLTPKKMTQKTDGKEWKVVWSDEFNEGDMPDTSKWIYDIGNWGWGNNELQYYTKARKENARIENGNLVIEARKNDMNQKWTSARLTTRGKVTFTYGRIEFKAKVPPNRGNWAAGWTLGDNYVDELSWPYCGEIDILESVGYEMDDESGNGIAHASAHCGAYYFKLGNQPTGTINVKNMDEDYHIYAVDWSPEGIIATVDGKEYFTYNDTSSELAWPFGQAQNIILNLAMGGGWGGLKGMDESITSQKMLVDYVRVYAKE